MPVAPARHAGPPALTHLACPRALAWALFVFAWGRALLGLVVGVFARWVVGVWCLCWGCVRWGVCAFLVLALWWGGGAVWLCPTLCPGLLGCVFALWCGLVGVCAAAACLVGGGWTGRGGTTVSRPYALLVSLPPLRGAWKRKRVWVPARSGERAHRGGEACGVELACSLAWCVQPTGGVKGEVGIGPCRAGLASVRAVVGLGGDWVARLPSWWWGWVGGNDFPR